MTYATKLWAERTHATKIVANLLSELDDHEPAVGMGKPWFSLVDEALERLSLKQTQVSYQEILDWPGARPRIRSGR